MKNNNINKIYIGGAVMSGKNILWRLLDGHTKIVSNVHHNNIGSFILHKDCKKLFTRRVSKFERESYKFIPNCQIAYKTGETVVVPIGRFFHAMYCFSQYSSLYSYAKGGGFATSSKEGELEKFESNFNTNVFEDRLEKEIFFNKHKKLFSEEELVDIIYLSYICAFEDERLFKKLTEKDFHFVDTLSNGIESINMVQDKMPGAKIIIMTRGLESLVFANSSRISGYKGSLKIDNDFKRVLYNQSKFVKKINNFYNEALNLKKRSDNVLLVDFDDLILRTEYTMMRISRFLELDYEVILSTPTINGIALKGEGKKIIGKINDNPKSYLGASEMDLLSYSIFGFDTKKSLFINFCSFIKFLKWRQLYNLGVFASFILRLFLPKKVLMYIKTLGSR